MCLIETDLKFSRGGRETRDTQSSRVSRASDEIFPERWWSRARGTRVTLSRGERLVLSDFREIVSPPTTDIYGRLEILGVVRRAV